MSKRNRLIFLILKMIAWIIFVGLSIEAGGLIVNFIFSLYRPGFIPNLYQKLDLMEMYHRSHAAFFSMYGFALSISVLKAIMFYIVIRLVSRLDLSKPFSAFAARQITLISYFTLIIGLLSYTALQTVRYLQGRAFNLDALSLFWVDSEAFILMAAVIYIIAVIFNKGVEIQKENDLTV